MRLAAELIAGFPLMKIKATVLDAETAEEGSDDIAFVLQPPAAFEQGLQNGKPVLLEPIMRLSITTPEDYLGDFVGDLQMRRLLLCLQIHVEIGQMSLLMHL